MTWVCDWSQRLEVEIPVTPKLKADLFQDGIPCDTVP